MKQTDIPVGNVIPLKKRQKYFRIGENKLRRLAEKIKCKLADYEWQSYSD